MYNLKEAIIISFTIVNIIKFQVVSSLIYLQHLTQLITPLLEKT